ncbi:hypothetical protein CR513_40068, partial [Mucuna pruriens]
MQVLNLRRELKALKMKESETNKEFSNKLSKVVTQIKFLCEELSDQKFINALQAIKHRRSLRIEENIEVALVAHIKGKTQSYYDFGKKQFGGEKEESNKGGGWKNKFPPFPIARRITIPKYFVHSSQTSNVGLATSFMWKRFEKIKQINRNNKLKWLNLKNKIESIYLLLLRAIQKAITKRYS